MSFCQSREIVLQDLVLTQFEKQVSQLISTADGISRLGEMLVYVLLPPGKLIRPRFYMALREGISEVSNEDFNLSAFSLELLHVATLLHDDLPALDNDDLRRGRPSCHKRFTEGETILLADYMFGQAASLSAKDLIDSKYRGASTAISRACARIAEGQFLDLSNQVSSLADYQRLINLKTGALFAAAAEMAVAELSNEEDLISLSCDFGLSFGRLFQIHNDWLDFSGDHRAAGRDQSSDAKNQKLNIFSGKFSDELHGHLTAELTALQKRYHKLREKTFKQESPNMDSLVDDLVCKIKNVLEKI